LIFNSSSNSARIVGLEQWSILSSIPVLRSPFIALTIMLLFISYLVLFRTKF